MPTSGTDCSARRERRARSSSKSTPTWQGAGAARGRTALSAQGMEVAPSSPEDMGALMRRDAARWAGVVKQAGIKAE